MTHIPAEWIDARLRMDGAALLCGLPEGSMATAFFDPQYRGLLDKMRYGNEGKSRQRRRSLLAAMSEDDIKRFTILIGKVLRPSGHLFLWVDKFHLLNGFQGWIWASGLHIVDMIVWDKDRLGMGYRARNVAEYCIVCQKPPLRAKGVWTRHDIRNVWTEKVRATQHPHAKPLGLIMALIEATTGADDYVLDPCAGSFVVRDAARHTGRHFIGCDIQG